MKTYAFTDVHGRLDLLERALAWIEDDCGDEPAHVVGLGDYVDRGPDSKGVIDRLAAGPRRPGDVWTMLRGNHDDMMLRALSGDVEMQDHWLCSGGLATLESYGWDARSGADPVAGIPRAHIDWLRGLRLWAQDEHRYYVHAGFRPGRPVTQQDPEDMLWIRDDFLLSGYDFGKLVVHGHTPNKKGPERLARRLNLDTGAVFKRGFMTVAAWDEGAVEPRFWSSLEPAPGASAPTFFGSGHTRAQA